MRATLGLALVLFLAFGRVAWAGAPTDQLRAYGEQVMKVLDDTSTPLAQRRESVRRIASEVFDTPEAAARALGTHWRERTPAEREEFTRLFGAFLEQTYISRIGEYSGEAVQYVSEQIDGDRAVVQAKIVTSRGPEVPVVGYLLHKGDRWLIYDIALANVSLVANFRSQFDHIIRTSSYEALVRRLQMKLQSMDDDKAGTAHAQAPR